MEAYSDLLHLGGHLDEDTWKGLAEIAKRCLDGLAEEAKEQEDQV